MKKYLIILFVLLWYASAEAVDVFVDNTNACNGAGTTGNPYCSIQLAFTNAVAGHVIKIRTGTGVYSEAVFVTGKNGSSGSPIVVQPDTGAKFIVRNNAGPSHNSVMRVKESDYWEFRGLTFDAAGVDPGWQAIFLQCETKNCVGWVIDGNTFKNWTTTSTLFGPNVVAVNGCDTGFGCAANRNVSATITNNTFTDNEGYNIGVTRTSGTIGSNTITGAKCAYQNNGDLNWGGIYASYNNSSLIIENNIMSDFQSLANCVKSPSAFPVLFGYWCDVGGTTTTIRKNRIDNLDAGSEIGVGLFVEANCVSHQVENNVISRIIGSAGGGVVNSLHAPGGATNFYYNNTIQGSTYGIMTKEGTLEMKNNLIAASISAPICHGCTSGSPGSVTLTSDFNLYQALGSTVATVGGGVGNKNLADWRTYCGCDANSKTGDPKLVGTPSSWH